MSATKFLKFLHQTSSNIRLWTKAAIWHGSSSLASCVASSRRRPAARTRGNRVATLPARSATEKTSTKTFKALFHGWVLGFREWNGYPWNGRGIRNMYCKNPSLCLQICQGMSTLVQTSCVQWHGRSAGGWLKIGWMSHQEATWSHHSQNRWCWSGETW